MPKVAKVSSSDELGLSAGKNNLPMMPANSPNTVKSNHSSALPMVEEMTTRRRIDAMLSDCIPTPSVSAGIVESPAALQQSNSTSQALGSLQFAGHAYPA